MTAATFVIPRTAAIFAPMYNSDGKRDATGAFQPEARAFARLVCGAGRGEATVTLVDNRRPKPATRRAVLDAVGAVRPDRLVFFCHGWKAGIQFGIGLEHLEELAAACSQPPIVTLYACSTAAGATGGDGGFADALRDALCLSGAPWCRVDAHTTAGHTTRNPYVRRFDGLGSPVGGQGGQWIVAPPAAGGNAVLWKRWVAALRTDFRFQFPELEISEIHRRLLS